MNLLSLYSFLCTEKLLNEKKIFMEKLKTFVTKEQTRINNITNIDL